MRKDNNYESQEMVNRFRVGSSRVHAEHALDPALHAMVIVGLGSRHVARMQFLPSSSPNSDAAEMRQLLGIHRTQRMLTSNLRDENVTELVRR